MECGHKGTPPKLLSINSTPRLVKKRKLYKRHKFDLFLFELLLKLDDFRLQMMQQQLVFCASSFCQLHAFYSGLENARRRPTKLL